MTKKIDEWIHHRDKEALEEALEALTNEDIKENNKYARPQSRRILKAQQDIVNLYDKEGA